MVLTGLLAVAPAIAPGEPAPADEPAAPAPAPADDSPAPAPADEPVTPTPAPADQPTTPAPVPPPTDARPTPDYVTRDEYERLRREMDDVRRQVDSPRSRATDPAAPAPREPRASGGSIFDEDRFLVTGYASAGYVNRRSESTFTAGLNPVFVWRITDRIFVESEVEFELTNEEGEGATEVGLEYANLNFIVNDYVTIRAGLFLTPFNQFPERLHPSWINKLPDFPLAYEEEGGLVPFRSLGVEMRGAVPAGKLGLGGDGKFVYAAYVANGPSLIDDDEEAAGNLTDANFTDNNDAKTLGGRLGFLPVPELEVGASVQWGDVADGADALLLGLDASYQKEIEPLMGTIDARVEWVWSRVDTTTFDEDGSGGFGPLRFRNNRSGGYAQLAYRPTRVDNRTLRNVEFITRYDNVRAPGSAPGAETGQRLTFGVDYWLAPNVVLKAAYQLDDPHEGPHDNGLMLQAAIGF